MTLEKIFLILTILLFSTNLVLADSNGIWHKADDIAGSIFGNDEQDKTSNFSFINNVYFNQEILIHSVKSLNSNGIIFKTSNNIDSLFISNNGNIGIGTRNPSNKLDINGSIRIQDLKNCNNLYSDSQGNILCGGIGTGINFDNDIISADSNYLATQTYVDNKQPITCTGKNKALQWDGNNWKCETIKTSSGGGGSSTKCVSCGLGYRCTGGYYTSATSNACCGVTARCVAINNH